MNSIRNRLALWAWIAEDALACVRSGIKNARAEWKFLSAMRKGWCPDDLPF